MTPVERTAESGRACIFSLNSILPAIPGGGLLDAPVVPEVPLKNIETSKYQCGLGIL